MQLWHTEFTRKCFPHLKKKTAWKDGYIATMKNDIAKTLKIGEQENGKYPCGFLITSL